MTKRTITLPDGRYLIFYSFDDQTCKRAGTQPSAQHPEAKEGAAPDRREREKTDK